MNLIRAFNNIQRMQYHVMESMPLCSDILTLADIYYHWR